jgi:hypothetical protein
MTPPLLILGAVLIFGLCFGDGIDQAAICIGLAFAYFMSGQEGVET